MSRVFNVVRKEAQFYIILCPDAINDPLLEEYRGGQILASFDDFQEAWDYIQETAPLLTAEGKAS